MAVPVRRMYSLVVDCDQYYITLTDEEVGRVNDLLDSKNIDDDDVSLSELEELDLTGNELLDTLGDLPNGDLSIAVVDELNRKLKEKVKP